MQIAFFIPLRKIPSVTQQQHRISTQGGKVRIHDTAEIKAVRRLFRDNLAKYRPEAPLEGPIELGVSWNYMATEEHPAGTWKTTKPDTDNLIKIFKDEMTRLHFWHDDAQVCCEINTKIYNRISGVNVRIRTIPVDDWDLEDDEDEQD